MLSSAYAFNLDQSKILSFGNGQELSAVQPSSSTVILWFEI